MRFIINEAGEITAISQDSIAPVGETLEELQVDLEYYIQALKRSVLKMDEIVFVPMDKDSSKK